LINEFVGCVCLVHRLSPSILHRFGDLSGADYKKG